RERPSIERDCSNKRAVCTVLMPIGRAFLLGFAVIRSRFSGPAKGKPQVNHVKSKSITCCSISTYYDGLLVDSEELPNFLPVLSKQIPQIALPNPFVCPLAFSLRPSQAFSS